MLSCDHILLLRKHIYKIYLSNCQLNHKVQNVIKNGTLYNIFED